ncbi:MAG: hypothetical protein QNJ29_09125 [Rhizobiaceae bacterium]|nr:hypothetical protein [Rhizobiaceae bacterium]
MDIHEAYFACRTCYFDDRRLLDWVRNEATADELSKYEFLTDLKHLNDKKLKNNGELVYAFENFYVETWSKPSVRENEDVIRKLYVQRLREYTVGKCRTIDVCKMDERVGILMWDFEGQEMRHWFGDLAFEHNEFCYLNESANDTEYMQVAVRNLLLEFDKRSEE